MTKKLISEAIKSIDSSFVFFVNNDGEIVWLDPRPQPSKELIDAKIKEIKKQEEIEIKYKNCENYILKYYSPMKQQSDQIDKEYHMTLLKAKGIENLELDIFLRIQRFFDGETLDEVTNVPEEFKISYLQLIKAGIRMAWVQNCKEELKKSIEENREPNFPKFPL